MSDNLVSAVIPALIGLLGTLLVLGIGIRQRQKEHPYSEEKRQAYKGLWEKLKEVEMERRSMEPTLEKYANAARSTNEFILKNQLYLDDEDYQLANDYMRLLAQMRELIDSYSDKIPELVDGWISTGAMVSDHVAEYAPKEQALVQQLDATQNRILAKCRRVMDS
jgi:hypothetical protein